VVHDNGSKDLFHYSRNTLTYRCQNECLLVGMVAVMMVDDLYHRLIVDVMAVAMVMIGSHVELADMQIGCVLTAICQRQGCDRDQKHEQDDYSHSGICTKLGCPT
jgi:hypothetical protein